MKINCVLLNKCNPKDKFTVLNTGLIRKDKSIVLCDEVGSPVANIKNSEELIDIIEQGYFESDIEYRKNEKCKFKILNAEIGNKIYFPKEKERNNNERYLELGF
jgi:hypothetical protein